MDGADPPASGEQAFIANLPLIDDAIRGVCRRYRCSADESEEFASHSHLKFIDGDYAILRKFEGRSSLRTYITIVVRRQFLDHRRQRWGTWRPSAEARRLGPVAVRLDTLLHRDRVGLEDAVERLRADPTTTETAEELRALAPRLPEHFARRMEGEAWLAQLAAPGSSAEDAALVADREGVRHGLSQALAASIAELSDQDRLALRLRYEDGLTIARIAHMLRVEAKPLYRRMERLLGVLKAGLARRGITDVQAVAALGEER